jgi:hypothetical protein
VLAGYSPESEVLRGSRVLRPLFPVEPCDDGGVVDDPPVTVAGVEGSGPRREPPGVVDDDDGPAAGKLEVGIGGTGATGDEDDGAPLVAESKGPATGASRITLVS